MIAGERLAELGSERYNFALRRELTSPWQAFHLMNAGKRYFLSSFCEGGGYPPSVPVRARKFKYLVLAVAKVPVGRRSSGAEVRKHIGTRSNGSLAADAHPRCQ